MTSQGGQIYTQGEPVASYISQWRIIY